VAKILVADDNSNVQKTVALALADLGVEVIAVNNGEAAVRKLGDISPDLVLADIFMPVRNGYEVCEFVKRDSRFSHIPVVLLVGAFDPLDEREAQRVGADGILKKPFVPPDPLIAMVKTLLDRTLGDRLVAVGASKPAAAAQSKASGIAPPEEHHSLPETSEELPMEESCPPVERLSFGEGERPIAFGQLLDAPAQESAAPSSEVVEPVDDEQILTSSRDASLGDPIFWRTEEPKPETEEENSEAEGDAGANAEEDISSGLPMRAWKPDEEAISRAANADFLQPVEPFELVRDENEEEAGKTSSIVESSGSLVQDAASQASLTVEPGKPEDLAANPIEWMASVPPPPADEIPAAAPDWGAADIEPSEADSIEAIDSEELKKAQEPVAPESSAASVPPVSVSIPTPEPPPTPMWAAPAPPIKLPGQTAEDTARSLPKQDWSDLASSLQAKPFAEQIGEKAKASQVPDAQSPSAAAANAELASGNTPPFSKPQKQSAEDTARSLPKQDWSDLATGLQTKTFADQIAEKAKTSLTFDPQPAVPTAANAEPAPVNTAQAPSKPITQSVEDTARSIPKQDWADLAASLNPKSMDSTTEKSKRAPSSAPPASALTPTSTQSVAASAEQSPPAIAGNAQPAAANSESLGSPDPALVEAVVQRILDKMRPQVVDIITKEFLRPVVQALVHREITKR
jgi:CheY-like chemotaxis protein